MRYVLLFVAAFCTAAQPSATAARTKEVLVLVVGHAPGGAGTTAARIIGHAVESVAHMHIVIENKSGADGAIAAEQVTKATDARTLLVFSSASAARIGPNTGLVPIGIIATFPFAMYTRKDGPIALIDGMTVGTTGPKTVPRLLGEEMFRDRRISMRHVPFAGSAPAIQSVLGGHIDAAIVPKPDAPASIEHYRVLAETGKDIETEGWIALFAPAGTGAQESGELSRVFERASGRAAENFAKAGFAATWLPSPQLRQRHEREHRKWRKLLDELGID